jgi:hypothetical protein
MPRATVVESRLDRAEFVFACRAGDELPEPGEVRVARSVATDARRIKMIALAVRVPQFDERSFDGIAIAVEDAPADVRDNARGNGQVVAELNGLNISRRIPAW